MTVDQPLPIFEDADDSPERARIAEALHETQFVEAGAGSGKTRELVERVVALVTADGDEHVPLREIAAITFTEKAGAELRDRIRRELEDGAAASDDDSVRDRYEEALADLDSAAIGTLHSFAQRILTEHPFAARLPPNVEVLDEVESVLAFDERWRDFVDRLLDDDTVTRALLLTLACGVQITHLRAIAVAFGANWDLVDRVAGDEEDPPELDWRSLADLVASLGALLEGCIVPDDDRLAVRIASHVEWAERLRAAPDELEALRLLVDLENDPGFKFGGVGRAESWGRDGACSKAEAVDRCTEVRDELLAARRRIAERAVRVVAARIGAFTVEAAEARRAEGRLEFHDLLVLARDLLRDDEQGGDVRATLARRYRRLLLDEFQDTDPIQVDLAVRIAAADPAHPDVGRKPWTDIAVDPGRLFVVGDPKQSIYRFRRADIATFLRARGTLTEQPLSLTRSFRASPAVVDWVNHAFGRLIRHADGSQPAYQPLVAHRTDLPAGPGVALIGVEPLPGGLRAEEQRIAEAEAVAAAVLAATAPAGAWEVTAPSAGGLATRAARLGDIAILLPARTSLPQLQDALDAHDIPYRAETSSLVYSTRQIRDLMAALRAVDDPTDELSLVAALRSPLYGCGDDDLFRYKVEHGGAWNHRAPRPESLPSDDPVRLALDHLAELHERRWWDSPSRLLEQLVADRRVLELGFASRRPRDLWRRVRFVIDQARAFADAAGRSGLRAFLAWASLQADEGSRVVETVLPETDDDSVRILTIHGAKGLEFPITIVSGMTTQVQHRLGKVEVTFPPDSDGYGLKVGSRVKTEEFERFEPIDEQMGFHEKLRLLYVAATRARDHLVVSVHRKDRALPADEHRRTHAELVWNAVEDAPKLWSELDVAPGSTATATPAPLAEILPIDEWRARRDAALAAASVQRVVAATTVARDAARAAATAAAAPSDARDPGLAKEPVDLELPPWNKGRYGTAIGRAVHGTLQTVDLVGGVDLEATARAQAAAEAVDDHVDVVAALARAALDSDVVAEAVAGAQYWRETYVATPILDGATGSSRILEGYVDLVYRTADGLVVVDYKTDRWDDDEQLAAKLERYRLQGASYALAVERAAGEPVRRCVFLFLEPGRATVREVADLAGAMRDVQGLVVGV
jgi:ATP-dependent exoDNAse (exonuclease V) beta subunit